MSYNLLDYSNTSESQNRTQDLKAILKIAKPDLLLVCELKNEAASNYLFNNAVLQYNTNFGAANFVLSQSTYTGLQQMAYYNKQKLILEKSSVLVTNARDINHYTFKINTETATTSPVRIEVFVTHLKASTGDVNRQKRLATVKVFTDELKKLPTNSFVLFAGDFNFYTSNEEGYQQLMSNNNSIVMTDPLNRPCSIFPNDGKNYFEPALYNSNYFWNNSSFEDIHTQATRVVAGADGAGGGMDDRFDFILLSKNFTTSANLHYVNNSYTVIGNNGNCYNKSVNDPSCTGIYSLETRNQLATFSDHLPVTLKIQSPQNTLAIQQFENEFKLLGSNFVKNKLYIQVNNLTVNKQISIYNQLGQAIKTVILPTANSKNKQYSIDVSQLAPGLYILRALGIKSVKFIKY